MHYPAQEISYQKLLGQLQDQGNTATIRHYLDVLRGGFLLTTLEQYAAGAIRQKASSPKIMPSAPALIHAFSPPDLEVKSGRRKRQQSTITFKKRFPAAKVLFLDWASGTRFLASKPTFQALFETAT